jgi:hypothetical protein
MRQLTKRRSIFWVVLSVFSGSFALAGQPPGLVNALEHVQMAPVPQTGMKISSLPGDDGDLQNGVPWPEPRFTDNGNDTVLDNLSGLEWMKHATDENGGYGFASMRWEDAIAACNSLNDAEQKHSNKTDNWRLPNLRELQSLVDYGNIFPALPPNHPFAGAGGYYFWSSTAHATASNLANAVHFGDGALGPQYKEYPYKVWCVRDGR